MPTRRELCGILPGRLETALGRLVQHLGDGRWWDEGRSAWRDGRGRALPRLKLPEGAAVRHTKVVLATAHLDHDPTDDPPRNLKALGQRCHRLHERGGHRRRRWLTLRARKALGDLSLGPYRTG